MQIQVDDIKEDEYLYANLVRNRKLPIHISELTRDQQLVDSLKEAVGAKETAAGEGACGNLIEASNTYKTDDPPEYSQLLQDALDAGLAIFKNEYPHTNDKWKEIWAEGAGANLAYLLGSTSTEIGCVIGKCIEVTVDGTGRKLFRAASSDSSSATDSTSKNNAVLFCELSPAVEKDSIPFDEEYFNGLIARTAKVAEMTEEDLKAPVEESAATTAGPTVLIADLAAMLAAASA